MDTGQKWIEDHLRRQIPMPGIELFTAAHGLVGRPSELFQGDPSMFSIEPELDLGAGVVKVSDLPSK